MGWSRPGGSCQRLGNTRTNMLYDSDFFHRFASTRGVPGAGSLAPGSEVPVPRLRSTRKTGNMRVVLGTGTTVRLVRLSCHRCVFRVVGEQGTASSKYVQHTPKQQIYPVRTGRSNHSLDHQCHAGLDTHHSGQVYVPQTWFRAPFACETKSACPMSSEAPGSEDLGLAQTLVHT